MAVSKGNIFVLIKNHWLGHLTWTRIWLGLGVALVIRLTHPQSMFIGNVNNNNSYNNNNYDNNNYCNNHWGCLLLSQLLQIVIWLFPSICIQIECQGGIPPCLWQQLQKWIVYNKGHEKVDVGFITMIPVALIQNSRVTNVIPGHYLSRFWDDILLVSHGVMISMATV